MPGGCVFCFFVFFFFKFGVTRSVLDYTTEEDGIKLDRTVRIRNRNIRVLYSQIGFGVLAGTVLERRAQLSFLVLAVGNWFRFWIGGRKRRIGWS